MPAIDDPAIPRRKLKGELRAARTAAGLTREDAQRDARLVPIEAEPYEKWEIKVSQ